MSDYGWILPEDVVYQALEDGLDLVNAAVEDGTIAELVARIYHNLRAEEQADIVTWWSTKDVKLIHGWPVLEHQELPAVAVLIDPEENTQQYLGDGMFQVVLSTGEHAIINGERWSANIAVAIHAENVDLLRWIYQWAKYVLSSRRAVLAATFRHRQQLSGRDLRPQKIGDSGRFVFIRALNFVCEFDQFDVARTPAPEITDVAGVTNVTGA